MCTLNGEMMIYKLKNSFLSFTYYRYSFTNDFVSYIIHHAFIILFQTEKWYKKILLLMFKMLDRTGDRVLM